MTDNLAGAFVNGISSLFLRSFSFVSLPVLDVLFVLLIMARFTQCFEIIKVQ